MNRPLPELVAAWQAAKAAESAANSARLAIERDIVAALPAPGAEGTARADIGGMRVTVKYGVSRKVDSDALMELWSSLPSQAQAAFRWKAELDTKRMRALQELLPDAYAKAAAVIEAKPSKPSVAVEPIAEEA